MKIGQKLPNVSARTSKGILEFPDSLAGKWVVLFSYMGAFFPVDTTDMLELDKIKPKLSAYDTEIIGISTDSVPSTLAWLMSMKNMSKTGTAPDIELISDKTGKISEIYGLNNDNERALYIIDENGILRAKQHFSSETGINTSELERLILALKTSTYQFSQTPANWVPGSEVLEYSPQTITSAQTNISTRESTGGRCVDWYLCYRQDSGLRHKSQTIGN